MKPVLVIAHVDGPVVGLVARCAAERGLVLSVRRPFAGERLPALSEVAAIVALGGPQSAYDTGEHPYLLEEERYLAAAADAGVPLLAICLGSQILARALGGSAQPGPSGLEAGFIDVKPADTARGDGTAGRFFSFHSDTMTPPDGAELLAVSDRYVQAWRLGSALAVQFHPEMTREGLDRLLGVEGEKLAAYGIDVDAMTREAEQYFALPDNDGRELLERWFDGLAR